MMMRALRPQARPLAGAAAAPCPTPSLRASVNGRAATAALLASSRSFSRPSTPAAAGGKGLDEHMSSAGAEMNNTKKEAARGIDHAAEAVKDAAVGAKEGFDDKTEGVAKAAHEMKENVKEGVSEAPGKVKGAAEDVKDAVKDAAGNVREGAGEAAQSVKDAVQGAAERLKGH